MLATFDGLAGLVPVKVLTYASGNPYFGCSAESDEFVVQVTAARYAYPRGYVMTVPARLLIARDGLRRSKFGARVRPYGTLSARPCTL